jgi:hypothetical protein
MRVALVISLVLSVTSLGCVHTQTVRTNTTRFDAVRQVAINEYVTVTLANRSLHRDVTLTSLTPDSTSWREPDGEVVSVPTSDVLAIRLEKKNRVRGALEGLGFGVVGGALGGAGFVGIQFLFGVESGIISSATAYAVVAGGLGTIGGLLGPRLAP